jgi:Na(+)-translocating NADH:ubiquinone oxidoreductase A subunit
MKFKGGYIFRNFQGEAEPVLESLPVPDKVFIPIPTFDGFNFSALVKAGQKVEAGEKIIGLDGGFSFCLVSPLNGTVSSADEKGVGLISDGSSDFLPVEGHIREPWNLDKPELFDLLATTGCFLALGKVFSSLSECESVDSVIISSMHNSPLNQRWSPEITGNGSNLTAGINILKKLFPKASITLAINGKNEEFFKKAGTDSVLKVKVLTDHYPQENPELLAKYLLNRRLYTPKGKQDKSIFIIDYSDLIRVSETITEGRPLIDKTYLVAGPGVAKPGWYKMRIGTSFEFIAKHLLKADNYGPWRIIKGDPLSGTAVTDRSETLTSYDHEVSVISDKAQRELLRFVMPGFNADSYAKTTVASLIGLLSKKLETSEHGGERPCVQCNFCDEVCPVDIYPFLIWKIAKIGEIESAFKLKPYECVSCGLCDYVCPSKINIAESVKTVREAYWKSRNTDVAD